MPTEEVTDKAFGMFQQTTQPSRQRPESEFAKGMCLVLVCMALLQARETPIIKQDSLEGKGPVMCSYQIYREEEGASPHSLGRLKGSGLTGLLQLARL